MLIEALLKHKEDVVKSLQVSSTQKENNTPWYSDFGFTFFFTPLISLILSWPIPTHHSVPPIRQKLLTGEDKGASSET